MSRLLAVIEAMRAAGLDEGDIIDAAIAVEKERLAKARRRSAEHRERTSRNVTERHGTSQAVTSPNVTERHERNVTERHTTAQNVTPSRAGDTRASNDQPRESNLNGSGEGLTDDDAFLVAEMGGIDTTQAGWNDGDQ